MIFSNATRLSESCISYIFTFPRVLLHVLPRGFKTFFLLLQVKKAAGGDSSYDESSLMTPAAAINPNDGAGVNDFIPVTSKVGFYTKSPKSGHTKITLFLV